VSREQREALDELLPDGPPDLGGDVSQQRASFDEMMAAIPVPDDVTASPGSLGGIPVVEVTVPGTDPAKVILYLHGGAFAIGSAASSVGRSRRPWSRSPHEDRGAPFSPGPAGMALGPDVDLCS
jgi:monoterpene epsilon-lactone hydrolase